MITTLAPSLAPSAALIKRSTGQLWEVVIGLETHAQLATRTKIFSGTSTAFGAEPNTQASAIDLALPGVLPVMNEAAIDCAIRFGLAVGATVASRSIFARKNYFYPDLPKGYQISQYEIPVLSGGSLLAQWRADEGGESALQQRVIRLTRAHLEEDAGKSLHEDAMRAIGGIAMTGLSGIDLNRAGTPLLEIVTEPDMRSAREAVAYAKALHSLVVWLGVCDGNMQEGSFRCDANVSVRLADAPRYGTRCEIKNLNSFRFIERAIEFEARRQIELIEEGGTVIQQTRLYDPDRDETRAMRSKEDAHDYRYFPDPDLPPLVIEAARIESIAATLPELPAAMRERLISEGLGEVDAVALTSDRATAYWFDQLVQALKTLDTAQSGDQKAAMKIAANWMLGEVAATVNRDNVTLERAALRPMQLAQLIRRVQDGTVSHSGARDVFQTMWQANLPDDDAADQLINTMGLRQISDVSEIEPLIDQVIAAHPKSVEEFRSGKEKAFNALVGQIMKASKGKANPQQVNQLLRAKLG